MCKEDQQIYGKRMYWKTWMSKLQAVDSKLFLSPFYFYFLSFSFQIISLSIPRTIIRVTRLCGHTSVTSDDIVTSHEIYRRT